jgi:hypothetical protein
MMNLIHSRRRILLAILIAVLVVLIVAGCGHGNSGY